MNVVLALQSLKKFIESELEGDVTTVPAVHIGYLPKKTHVNVEENEFPFVILRPLEGEDSDHETGFATIKLLFGTKSDDDEGFIDVLNVMERVRIALLKKRVLDQRYRLELPYKWKFHEEQPEPEWIGEATTKWLLPTVHEEVEEY